MDNEIQEHSNPAQGMVTGIMITLFASTIATIAYAAVFSLAFYKGKYFGNVQNMGFTILSVFMSVLITQILSRMIQGNKLTFMQAFLGGWMSSLILGMFISFFYSIFIKITKTNALPEGTFALRMMLFSMLGIFISLFLSLIIKKN
jgi:hypothetical protein